MAYQPPFSITPDILNLVADISHQVGRLDASGLNASPQLRKQNRIKSITGTLSIEGNTLTEEQITAIIEGKPVMGSVRELAEIKGAIAAYKALPSFTPSHISSFPRRSVGTRTNAPVNASVNASVNAPVNDIDAVDIQGLKTPEAIIALLAADKTLTRPQLAERIGKDIRTIGRALAKLQQAQRIKRVGSDKAGHWEVQS